MAGLQGDLTGKAAVVTGGGSGIGRALCLALADAGMDVLAADIDRAAAEDTAAMVSAKGTRGAAARCDVTDPEELVAVSCNLREVQAGPRGGRLQGKPLKNDPHPDANQEDKVKAVTPKRGKY